MSPLFIAAESGHTAVVRLLLSDPRIDAGQARAVRAGHPVLLLDRPLERWAYSCQLYSVVVCLSPPCVQDGLTPLNVAAYTGDAAIVSLLLADPSVDVNRAHDVRGSTKPCIMTEVLGNTGLPLSSLCSMA